MVFNRWCVQATWNSVETYANSGTGSTIYKSSLPALMLGAVFSTSDLVSLWAVFNTGEVLSAEWVSTSSKPVGHMYNPSNGLCWKASYSSSTGYGTWAQTTSGPLNTSCAAVTSAAWYMTAATLSSGANSTAAGTISSGYIGITHMIHETSHNVVFGGEMDGRTLSNNLNHGKPVQGEIYVVSATESSETLVAATESTVQSQLQSTSAVDPSTVGNLAGASASSLELSFGSFFQMWSRSATVSMADSYGQVATRCPSSTSQAYIAVTAGNSWFSGRTSSSLQHFQTDTDLQLMLVNTIHGDTYRSKIDRAVKACIGLSCVFLLTIALIFATVFSVAFRQLFADVVRSTTVTYSDGWQGLVKFAILLIVFQSVFWIICISAEHTNLRVDNFAQVISCVNGAVGYQFQVASSLSRQASAIWYHTGANTAGLSQLDCWTSSFVKPTDLLRFGTYQGVEQSVNGTSSTVLSHTASSDCLITYLADGVTQDPAVEPDCHSDPRYTEWYNAGRRAEATHTFSNFYDSSW